MEQFIVAAIVAIAVIYVGRHLVVSLRAVWTNKGGCASGCGKCGAVSKESGRPAGTRPNVIPLTEVRPLSRKDAPR